MSAPARTRHWVYGRCRVHAGRDALDDCLRECLGHATGGRLGLLTSASGAASPFGRQLRRRLAEAAERLTVETVPSQVPEHRLMAAVTSLRDAGVTALVAFGGGSVMDAGKLARAAIRADAPVEEIARLGHVELRAAIPLTAIPSTLGGAEVTPVAGYLASPSGEKRAVIRRDLGPDEVVLTAPAMAGVPTTTLAASWSNAVHHVVESWVCDRASPFSEAMGAAALGHLLGSRPLGPDGALGDPERALEGAHLAGHALAAAGSGVGHAICQTLSSRYRVPHGTLNAIALPRIVEHFGLANSATTDRLAALLGRHGHDAPSAMRLLEEVARAGSLPKSLGALGIPRDDIDSLTDAVARHRGTANTPGCGRGEVRELLCRLWESPW